MALFLGVGGALVNAGVVIQMGPLSHLRPQRVKVSVQLNKYQLQLIMHGPLVGLENHVIPA